MNAIYELAGISKQAYHKHKLKGVCNQDRVEQLRQRVQAERREHGGVGLEKLYYRIRPDWLGRDKFVRLFREMGYGVARRRKYARTTHSGPFRYPNLIEGLLVWDKNRLWQTDITYYRMGELFYYLTFIVDVYTKVIKGYSVSDHTRAEANVNALRMAVDSEEIPHGLIHHSDGGTQFLNLVYKSIGLKYQMLFSMGRMAQENAYAERVNGIIKNEYLAYKTITTPRQLKIEVKRTIDHYNYKRIHRHLPGKRSPKQFEHDLLVLSTQSRPKVIVYAEGNPKIRAVSNRPDFSPETEPQVHVCPMGID